MFEGVISARHSHFTTMLLGISIDSKKAKRSYSIVKAQVGAVHGVPRGKPRVFHRLISS
jgi:hypothetical protein